MRRANQKHFKMKIATKLTKRVAEFVNENKVSHYKDYKDVGNFYFHYPEISKTNHLLNNSVKEGYKEVPEQEFIDLVTAELAGKTDKVETFNPQPHYDNTKGSLYKIATERNWNAYTFDVVKRLDRGGKKDSLKQEIEKSIDVLKIWLNELEN